MEDAHCSESTMKTLTTRKISVLSPRPCCRMRLHTHVISPGFVLPLVLSPGLSVSTHALLLFLSRKGSCPPTRLPAILPQRESKLCLEGVLGYRPAQQEFLSELRAGTGTSQVAPSSAHPPTLAVISLDRFPKEGRLIKTRAFCSIISLPFIYSSLHKI